MRIFSSKEKSIDLSPTVKSVKHIGNVMFVLVLKKKNHLMTPFPLAYSSNLKYKLKAGLLADVALPQVMPNQSWAGNSILKV